MANLSSIARPYALAAFEYARDKQQLPAWKTFLNGASLIASDPKVIELLKNQEISSAKVFDLFCEILAPMMSAERKNFLLLLSQNKRLNALVEIAELFNLSYAALEKINKVRVVTAIDIEEDFRLKLIEALTKRTQHEVTLECEVDPSILGGAIIHMGDKVIDGSVRGRLIRLRQNLTG